MYGIVNKSIEDLIVSQFGQSTWEQVLVTSGIEVDFFITNVPYDDAITYRLAESAAGVLGISLDQVLNVFGEFWVVNTVKERYGGLMETGGGTLQDFLVQLPVFHHRVMLVYPGITPPLFKVSNAGATSIDVEYISHRQGLHEFVRGILRGLSLVYATPVEITLLQSRADGSSHEIFRVSWQ